MENHLKEWKRRFSEKEEEARAHAGAARRSLEEAVAILRKHGAKRIVLFGSLCSDSFHSRSDIDLAVDGIPKGLWSRAVADLLMALNHPVDLKPLDEVESDFRERILKKGIILYEEA